MEAPKLFENSQFGSVRVIPEGDSFWVVGADVLKALEYAEDYNPSRAFATIPEEWVKVQPIHLNLNDGRSQTREMLCLSEQGLYFFLGRSDKPKALPYQKWVAGEVIPSIRKTGEYVVEKPQALPPTALERLQMADLILSKHYEGNQLVLALDKVHVRLTGESVLQITNTQLVAPQQTQLYTPTEIGRQVEPPISAVKVNKILQSVGWQVKVNDKWEAVGDGVPYAVYLDTGKAHSDGTPIRQLKWTADVIFLVQKELSDGNL